MKTTAKIFFLLLLVGIGITGCKKLLDVTFQADFKSSIDTQANATSLKSTNAVFDETVTIDPASNSDYQKYADKIQDVTVTGVTGTITFANPTGVNLTSATIEVSKAGFTTVTLTMPNLPLAIAVGSTVTYDNADGQFTNLNAIFKDINPITIHYFGATDQPSVEFTYELTFSTEVTANPL